MVCKCSELVHFASFTHLWKIQCHGVTRGLTWQPSATFLKGWSALAGPRRHTAAQTEVPFSERTGKTSSISLQEGLFSYFTSETLRIPAPASLLWHKALWGLPAKPKLPQISKIQPKRDGRPLKSHTPGFCEYLEADYCKAGRLSRRQSWWDWFSWRGSLAELVFELLS